jgi:hypothetical protein
MNRITRLLAMTGIGLAAGVAIAGPAQAATAGSGHSASASAAGSHAFWNDDDDVVGYFNSPIRCERAGRIGEIRDRWDDYDCNRVSFGFHRGDWELSVSYCDDNHGNGPWGHDNGWHRPGPFGGPFGGPGGHGPFGGPGGHGGPGGFHPFHAR